MFCTVNSVQNGATTEPFFDLAFGPGPGWNSSFFSAASRLPSRSSPESRSSEGWAICVQVWRLIQVQDLCLPRDHDGIRLKRPRSGLPAFASRRVACRSARARRRGGGRPAEPRRRGPDQAAKARSVLSRRSTWAVRSSHAASWPAKSLVRPISSSTRAVSTT